MARHSDRHNDDDELAGDDASSLPVDCLCEAVQR
jgi:hypothetical protein